jgi:hypothetical protein
LEKKWLFDFWSIAPRTLITAEDIHVSATCSIRKKSGPLSQDSPGSLAEIFGGAMDLTNMHSLEIPAF